MKLEINSLWSPDCDAITDLPADREDSEVLISVSLCEEGEEDTELFCLRAELRLRLEKLLRQAQSRVDWNQVVAALTPYLRYEDEPLGTNG